MIIVQIYCLLQVKNADFLILLFPVRFFVEFFCKEKRSLIPWGYLITPMYYLYIKDKRNA